MTIEVHTRQLLQLAEAQQQRHRGAATWLGHMTRELQQQADAANFPMPELARLANYYGFCVLHADAARLLLSMVRSAIANTEEPVTNEIEALAPLLEKQVRSAA